MNVSIGDDNLIVKNPTLAGEWHPTKNTSNPSEYKPSSGKKVWWLCSSGHEWVDTIDHRKRGRKCPYCMGKRATKERNLVALYPHIAAEWHPTKNSTSPENVLPVSAKKAWWLCKMGHNYQCVINHRTLHNTGCKICNSLAIKRPDIAAEWHPTLNGNITPYDISSGIGQSYIWQCSLFNNHIWKALVSNRTGVKNSGCPFCRLSKGEKKIKETLENFNLDFKTQFKFDDCCDLRPLPFDFVIFHNNQKIAIEFNGEQHYRVVPYWGGTNKYKTVQYHDTIKENYCKTKNIPLLTLNYKDKNLIGSITKFLKLCGVV